MSSGFSTGFRQAGRKEKMPGPGQRKIFPGRNPSGQPRVPPLARIQAGGRKVSMRIVLFGGTGMVGQGVLRECLAAPDVERVLAVGRTALGGSHERSSRSSDLFDLSQQEPELTG
jgi:hypothetical protein